MAGRYYSRDAEPLQHSRGDDGRAADPDSIGDQPAEHGQQPGHSQGLGPLRHREHPQLRAPHLHHLQRAQPGLAGTGHDGFWHQSIGHPDPDHGDGRGLRLGGGRRPAGRRHHLRHRLLDRVQAGHLVVRRDHLAAAQRRCYVLLQHDHPRAADRRSVRPSAAGHAAVRSQHRQQWRLCSARGAGRGSHQRRRQRHQLRVPLRGRRLSQGGGVRPAVRLCAGRRVRADGELGPA
mmetsp:Transcript_17683/g.56724  ORF Transcript_17683/g.56724 Transcript_17683/m.56724 type:complete len:234 (-) Transcript_17683:122-823(-)